jgi:hypothetical protein
MKKKKVEEAKICHRITEGAEDADTKVQLPIVAETLGLLCTVPRGLL